MTQNSRARDEKAYGIVGEGARAGTGRMGTNYGVSRPPIEVLTSVAVHRLCRSPGKIIGHSIDRRCISPGGRRRELMRGWANGLPPFNLRVWIHPA
jgi:hypothetical protein